MARRRPAAPKAATTKAAPSLLLLSASAAVAVLLLAASGADAAGGRALLQDAPAAAAAAAPALGGAGGFGSLFQALPLKDMLGAGGKAFSSWRQGAKQLAKQKVDGPDAEIVGGADDGADNAASSPGAPAAYPPGAKPLVNSSVEAVPLEKRLFAYNTTGRVGGEALPEEPKDGKFTLLPAGCALAQGQKQPGGGASNSNNACTAVRLEANAGANILEGGRSGGLVSTDTLNATASARATVVSDFARLTLRYKELSLDDGVPGVPVPFDFSATLAAADGARLNGSAKGSAVATLAPRMWGMWTNGEPAIPLRSGIFTLISTNESIPFELMGAKYQLSMVGLPMMAKRIRGSDDRLFVPTPRDALLGAVALRKQLGSEWARGMRLQSMYVPRNSPVKIIMLPARVELVEPSKAMFDAVEAEKIQRVKDAAAAEVKAAEDAQAAAIREVEEYRAALLEAAASGNATAVEEAAAGGGKAGGAGDQGPKQMPLPWRDDATEGFDGNDAGEARRQKRRERKEAQAQAGGGGGEEAHPSELAAQAAGAVDLLARGVPADEAERRAKEAAAQAKAKAAADAAAAAAAAAAEGEEVYEDEEDK